MKKIVVIGDCFIDKFIFGNSQRLSPEAPVPVFETLETELRLGGASNVAHNIRSLGGDCTIVGKGGNDLTELLTNYNKLIFPSKTNYKIRYMVEDNQILRVDDEKHTSLSDREIEEIMKLKMDIVIICDYDKGMINKKLMNELKKKNITIIVDPKKISKFYSDVFLIKPNIHETSNYFNRKIKTDKQVEKAGLDLRKRFNSNILVTRGKEGMTLFGTKIIHYPAQSRQVYDVIGAGDTVIATIAFMLSKNDNLENSVFFSNKAAGIVVEKKGTSVVYSSELFNNYNLLTDKVLRQLKKYKKKIVFTNGCFDILHTGHLELLNKARTFGDCLIVGINSDKSVNRIKGSQRPIINQYDRAQILSNMKSVDYVVFFDENTPCNLINKIRPDIHVKGSDYDPTNYNNMPESRIINDYGGKIELVKIEKEISTTKIIQNIKKANL